jgi:hydroxymethylpyrimidine/phosphomethylpyrimidine kinase
MLQRVGPEGTVYAPVLRAGGTALLTPETRDAARRLLFPAVRVVVVRVSELPVLAGREVEDLDGMRACAAALRADGARAVILAGLPLRGRVFDLLDDGGSVAVVDAARVHAPRVSGLGGAYAAALTAHLARGAPLLKAAEAAQRYVALRLMRGR